MSIVTASDLAVSYGAHDVFAGVGFEIPRRARFALIGPNGSGKTSLLRLVAGLDLPSSGSLQRARGLSVGYLPQVPEFSSERNLYRELRTAFADLDAQAETLRSLEAEIAAGNADDDNVARYDRLQTAFETAGGYTIENRIDRVLTGLGFASDDRDRSLGELSGGQQTRALLGRLLLESPDLLLLDEPTNHLDVTAVEWLESFFRDWDGALVAIAHDRAFLDTVAERVWELAGGRLTAYRGNYSHYAQQRAAAAEAQLRAYERQQAEIERAEDFVRRNIAGQNTKQAQGRRKSLERMELLRRPHELDAAANVKLRSGARSGDRVIQLKDLAVGYGGNEPLFVCDEIELHWRETAALLGPNGSGKTTLLRTIIGELPPLAGVARLGGGVRVGYFSQSHDRLVGDKTVLEHVMDASGMLQAQARSFVGRYRFSGDEAFKPVDALSGGERARVALALLELDGANLLILDEPTNHLDVHAQEMLQAVLADFDGTTLLVSHDRFLIRALGGTVWAIHDGRLHRFVEGYDAYRLWLLEGASDGGDDRTERRDAYRDDKRAAREAERETRRRLERRESLEAEIHALEARLVELEEELHRASALQHVDKVTSVGEEYATTKDRLDDVLETWFELDDDGDAATASP